MSGDFAELSNVRDAPGEERRVAAAKTAREIIEGWNSGEPVDARAALQRYEELRDEPSFVLDLAYQEFCLRVERGEEFDATSFCRQFPDVEDELYQHIELREYLVEHPDLLDRFTSVCWPSMGDSVEGFTIVDELGRGAFARVYLAEEDAVGQRLVVLKLSMYGEAEAEKLGKLGHPNVVPVLTSRRDHETGLTVLCMPFCGRATLHDLSRRLDPSQSAKYATMSMADVIEPSREGRRGRDLSDFIENACRSENYLECVLDIVAQIAEGLDGAHQQGILHLDLKPSNVLMTDDGQPMLIDFNLALKVDEGDPRLGGTLPYMSPEQIQRINEGENAMALVDARSDIFSLGVILFELLTAELPFGFIPQTQLSKVVASELLTRHEQGAPGVRTLNPAIDKRIGRLVDSCLALDPEARPKSAAALAAELRDQLRAPRRSARWVQRHRLLTGVTVSSLVGCIALVVAGLLLRPPYHERQLAAGIWDYSNGNLAAAVQHFDQALEYSPEFTPALVERARAKAKQEKYLAAAEDLERVVATEKAPEYAAYFAYCFQMHGSPGDSIRWYEVAVDERGSRSAAVFNNLAFDLYKFNQLRRAEFYLGRAIKLDRTLVAPSHNRALVRLRLEQHEPGSLAGARKDMQHALRHGPPSIELFRDAAIIYAVSGQTEPKYFVDARKYLRQAIEADADVNELKKDSNISQLFRQNPELNSLRADPRVKIDKRATQIIEPSLPRLPQETTKS